MILEEICKFAFFALEVFVLPFATAFQFFTVRGVFDFGEFFFFSLTTLRNNSDPIHLNLAISFNRRVCSLTTCSELFLSSV